MKKKKKARNLLFLRTASLPSNTVAWRTSRHELELEEEAYQRAGYGQTKFMTKLVYFSPVSKLGENS